MKHLTILLACGLILVAAGCSDDDDPVSSPGVATVTPMGFVSGSLYLEPQAYIDEMVIFGFGATPPNIDSIKIGDSLLFGGNFFDYDYDEDYHENYWLVEFDETGSNYMYEHGDTAVMKFYGDGKMSTSTFVILDADTAAASIVSPIDDADTVTSYSSSSIVVWDKVEHAEYYAIWLEFTYGMASEDMDRYTYTTDTTFTVDSTWFPDSLDGFYISVIPFTGPDPRTGKSNVSGDYLTGKVYSFGWSDYIWIYGWYTGGTSSPRAEHPVSLAKRTRSMTPSDVIDQVYKNAK